jgi:DnaJ-class molecular chaperone
MAKRDLYSLLGVQPSVSQKDLRNAYRKLARKFHPDVNSGDKQAEARFKEINAAYDVLSDPEKRRKYDKYGEQWEHADQIEDMQRQRGGAYRFGDSGGVRFEVNDLGDLGDLSSIFGGIFGGRPRQRGPRRGANVEQAIEVTLEEAFHGTKRTLQVSSQEACATCGGSGELAGAICHVCQGAGAITKPRRLEVTVPAGVDTGSRVRIAGEGENGLGGSPKGDLLLVVKVRPHTTFERKGADLQVEVDIPVTTLVLGGEVEIPTLTGSVMLKVPELSQNGKVFRLAGLGMPRLKGKGRGDLLAKLRVKLPESLGDEDRERFEELRKAGV